MATRAQKTKVGLFLVVCFALIAGGLVMASGYRHEEQLPYWVLFEESVSGLSAGGQVQYLGVPVGSVSDIQVTQDGNAHVEIQVSKAKVTLHEGVEAKLVMYSLATGVLLVMLEGGDAEAPELPPGARIPSQPSLTEAVSSRVETILDELEGVIGGLRTQLDSLDDDELQVTLEEFRGLIKRGGTFIDETGTRLDDVRDSIVGGVDNINDFVADARDLTANLKDTVAEAHTKIATLRVADNERKLTELLNNMTVLTEQLAVSVGTIDEVMRSAVHEVDTVQYGLAEALRTAGETLDSIRSLVDSIEQDPSQLLRGRGKPSGS